MNKYEIQYDEICKNKEIIEKNIASDYNRHNVGLCLELNEKRSGSHFVVVSTHLFWNPVYEEVKISQVKYLMNYINEINKIQKLPVVICGDFNSMPNSSVYNYMISECDEEKDKVEEIEKMKFESVYGVTVGEPEFTNYTETFRATIDYIFISKNKVVPKKVLMINAKDLEDVVTLPNEKHGSDHLPVGCELGLIM